jgi:thiamine biosynthesis lipoprotein
MNRGLPLLFVVLLAGSGFSCKAEPYKEDRYALGTQVQIKFYRPGDKIHAEPFFNELQRMEKLFSRSRAGSDPLRVLAGAGQGPVAVYPETLRLTAAAMDYYRLSEGLFDPTIAPLVDLWGIGSDHPRVPAKGEINDVLSLVDGSLLVIDPVSGTIELPRKGMGLELGAIAKGFMAEELAAFLMERGVTSAIINLGGNVRVIGEKPDGSPFVVSVQDPLGPRGRAFGTVAVRDMSVVTSGVYERYFEKDGVRYHHILDPRTGRPADTGLLSVTIITRSGTDADGLSTTVFLLGAERGLALIESLSGTECVLITTEKNMLLSSGAEDFFTPANDNPYKPVTVSGR